MKWIRGILCMPIVLLQYLGFKLFSSNEDFWEYSYQVIGPGKHRCLAKWLFISAISDKNPERIVRIYQKLREETEELRLTKRSAIAVFESAVWQKDEEVAASVLKMLAKVVPPLSMRGSKRLECLFLWRFSKNTAEVVGLSGLVSPLMPHESVLAYVDYFARATIADSEGKSDDALRYYQTTLKDVPQNSEEYRYAMERCNALLNK